MNLGGKDTITKPQVGLIAGYDVQLGQLVLGAMVDASYQGSKRNRFSQLAGTPVHDEVQIPFLGHLLARVGWDFGGWLVYASAGGVGATVKASHTGLITPTQAFTWRQTNFRIAKSYGGGVEALFGNGWSMRAEYLYDYWGAKRYDWVPGQRYSNIALTVHNFRFVLAKRFGAAPPPPPPAAPPPPPPAPPAVATQTCPDGSVIAATSACPAPPPPPLPPPPPAPERG